MIWCLRDNFQFFFFQEVRNLGKKLISQQDCLLESQRSEAVFHFLDVDRASWSQIYDWISSSSLIMMKWHAKATADVHQFQGARPHAGKVPKVCTSRKIEKQVYNTGLCHCLWVSFIVQGVNNGEVPPARKLEWNWCTSAVALACTSPWSNAKAISNH